MKHQLLYIRSGINTAFEAVLVAFDRHHQPKVLTRCALSGDPELAKAELASLIVQKPKHLLIHNADAPHSARYVTHLRALLRAKGITTEVAHGRNSRFVFTVAEQLHLRPEPQEKQRWRPHKAEDDPYHVWCDGSGVGKFPYHSVGILIERHGLRVEYAEVVENPEYEFEAARLALATLPDGAHVYLYTDFAALIESLRGTAVSYSTARPLNDMITRKRLTVSAIKVNSGTHPLHARCHALATLAKELYARRRKPQLPSNDLASALRECTVQPAVPRPPEPFFTSGLRPLPGQRLTSQVTARDARIKALEAALSVYEEQIAALDDALHRERQGRHAAGQPTLSPG